MGRADDFLDPSKVTESGNNCLYELAYLAGLAHESKVTNEWVIVSSTTLVETHFNHVLMALIEESKIRTSKLGNALLKEELDDMLKTWSSRLKWLKDGFGISIAGDPLTQGYLFVVELRNALVHGRGELTSFQQRNLQQMLQLKRDLKNALGVSFRGPRVELSDQVRHKALLACRRFTFYLDSTVLATYKSLRT